ncbi:TPA: acetyltransferase, partial [Escherichia coli]|nr:acetyltransferase [Escherichia coli]
FGRGVIFFSDNVQVNDYVHIASIESVTIGRDTLIASKVFITDHNHGSFKHSDPMSSPNIPPDMRTLESSAVVIGQRVWLGENVTVLPGTIIGNGVVVGANSVVRGSIPENTVIAGVPAKIIKKYNHETKLWEKA